MKQQDKTVISNVIDYCNWLYDFGNKGNRTDLEMFQVLKELADNFNKTSFRYSIIEIRNFIYTIEFAIPKIKPDSITDLKDGQDYHDLEYFYFTLSNVHRADDNTDFNRREEIFSILFDENETLRERILRLKKMRIVFHKNIVDLLRFSDIAEAEYIRICEIKPTAETKNQKIEKEPLTFAGLFKLEFQSKLVVLFERLQLKGLTDENNNWIINNSINEPAKLYYYLKDNKVLKDIKFAPAIKCFYNEFGCEVVGKANGNPRSCTRINLLIECDEVTEKMYNSFLLSLINQK